MLVIQTPNQKLAASQEVVYAYMSDMNNLQHLMPEQVTNWKSDIDACSYTIKGMADIGMRITARKPSDQIEIHSEGKGPFSFSLLISIWSEGSQSFAGLKFEGDVNPFLSMMVEKPLSNFFNLLMENLGKQFA
jgi:hypothetical protein